MRAEEEFPELETMSQADLDREIQKYRQRDAAGLQDGELRRICAIHRLAARRTSGPPKTSGPKGQKKEVSLDDLGLGL